MPAVFCANIHQLLLRNGRHGYMQQSGRARLPPNEAARLKALDDLAILDTEPEEVFDRITRLASYILGVPIVLISLVDEERQWFKSRLGLDASETHRDLAFCSHAILSDELFVIPDATADERFAQNPLVTGAPDIRFYAGAPLTIRDGIRLGTLCAIDTEPRVLDDEQIQALQDLAAIVVDELALRQSSRRLTSANDALEQFAFTASHDLRAPLKKLVNLADIAMLDSGDDELRPLLKPIQASAFELERVVSDLATRSSAAS